MSVEVYVDRDENLTTSTQSSRQSNNVNARKQSRKAIDAKQYLNYDPEKEPIKAFLRIRPRLESQSRIGEKPYLRILNKEEVCMIPPENSKAYRTKAGTSEKYRFTQVFDGSTSQQTFFTETTLDLVKDVLNGGNALLFAYGVTSSGKTYSVVGRENEHAGLLPRTLMTIFNSIKGHESEKKIQPIMHSSLRLYQNEEEENRHVFNDIASEIENRPFSEVLLNEKLIIDTRYEYGVWVSFVEIYNEKIYDLLDFNKLTKRKHLQMRLEPPSSHKYVVNANIVKLNSIHEAYSIVELGQKNRQVFSTLMNESSSRSHSIFTVHIVRSLKSKKVINEDNLSTSAIVSKLSIVDLAGSERYRNTNSTGMRLREAGNINKSLMVLGQCMEVLRMNQLKKELGKNLAIVPYRHSKLTELFKSTFEGDGRAVIIVNVNPYDTGYDENIHVMRFSAVAKDVVLQKPVPQTLEIQQQPSNDMIHCLQHVLRSLDDNSNDDEDIEEGLVDGLIAQLEELWEKWVDAETKITTMEMHLREQISKEMSTELKRLETSYLAALQRENEKLVSHLDEAKESKSSNKKGLTKEDTLFEEIYERQKNITAELEYFRDKLNGLNVEKAQLLEKISALEKENMQERAYAQTLLAESQKLKANSNSVSSTNTEARENDEKLGTDMEIDAIVAEGNDELASKDTFDAFLSLRKQLRRSIFKKEDLNEDVDKVMSKVEQFPNVSFDLAKETKMGRLLKMISQEKFENDPYHIRKRALRLFKRYAQLKKPEQSPSPPAHSDWTLDTVSNRTGSPGLLDDSMDIEQLIAENFKLKQKVKLLSAGQQKLKEAFEKTRVSSLKPAPPVDDTDNAKLATKLEDKPLGNSSIKIKLEPNSSSSNSNTPEQERSRPLVNKQKSHRYSEPEDYDNDLSEIMKQAGQPKKRRKLRAL
ncbi:kinesin motor domain-containing protein [Mycotypha africana]|uniref:kinesin motor domain-containing protein n=1 Tax=Mycotypha africana TaxID=64632 RepID=UPI002300D8E4|nr:kinesin motor domain-containing protein [Mycotypha africana]KAI8984350.1 kinesin motor domain-containing protein [Mycotypha africana]